MSTAYASPADVATLLGRDLDEHDTYTVAQQLDVASAKMRVRVPSIEARIEGGTLDPVLVRDVAAKAVFRFMRNRLGLKNRTLGPESVGYGDDGGVVITEEDVADLLPPVAGRSRAFTVDPTPAGAGTSYPDRAPCSDPAWLP